MELRRLAHNFCAFVIFICMFKVPWQNIYSEYDARLERYDERIWTCKSTGSNQLTHKEAWEEEQEVTEL